ncbi:MAG: glycosyltransferase family 4 protein [Saprospiraceae bacterium]|nr:glycosyltransferase family 4 protein [Saprospiraceae bacterium]
MNRKKTIAFFGIKYYPSQGGSSRLAESIARELQDKYDITIYCYSDPKSQSHLKLVRAINIPRLPFGSVGVFFYYFICSIHLMFSKKYDLIHVHKTDSSLFIPLLALRSKIVATSQEAPYVRDKWSQLGKTYFRLMEKIFMKSPAELTSVSKPLAEYYEKQYHRSVHFIPNGVDIITERADDSVQEILQGIKRKEYFFFAARRIMSTKGLHTFLKAMQKINHQGPIIIAGQDSHAISYMKEIRNLTNGLMVTFIGYISDRPTLLTLIENAKFFVFPSETEGLSLMLLEAASAGMTPIICSDIPENLQVFTDEEVIYFRNKDAADLAEKITWAEINSEETLLRADRARAKVLENYSSRSIAKQYDQLYTQILYRSVDQSLSTSFTNPEKSLNEL